ncbi:uncharacterized protein MONBRDRAFT_11417 [Monosiga brevicollis MX1]|uniref:PHD-type domain-containing protein n=1 Tax=Monosiga brevicollis TaxID=81824 RepID=A9V9F9_MONBE|nr:uncharacterized protein MONBRDRAFT_11417 [Monosiga brevicollis MX1]EDQ85789.1 predicted protein [Monosiga brevicollis MX1]|eukprot:XP_001749268.1 hypothetical protein [Monosiga brevicollis MX1]
MTTTTPTALTPRIEQLFNEDLPSPSAFLLGKTPTHSKFSSPTGGMMTVAELDTLLGSELSSATPLEAPEPDISLLAPAPTSRRSTRTSTLGTNISQAIRSAAGAAAANTTSSSGKSNTSPSTRQLRKRRVDPQAYQDHDSSDDDAAAEPTPKRNHALHSQPSHDDDDDGSSHRSASRTMHDSDDDLGHDLLMSPEEEAELRQLLAKRQAELDECTKHMKGMTPAQKKRLRNKHASCVSRLKKKLYICNLVRELDRAKETAAAFQDDMDALRARVTELEAENQHLRSAAGSADSAASYVQTETAADASDAVMGSNISEPALSPSRRPEAASGVVCLCHGEPTKEMLCCNVCSDWFHYECLGLSKKEHHHAFTCPPCVQRMDFLRT